MSLRPMDSEYKRAMAPSLGLLVLSSLTPEEHTIKIEDENVGRLYLNDKPDLVGITVNVDTSKRAYAIAQEYRNKNVPVIFGGIHASAVAGECLKYADSVCVGEAEELWRGILEDAAAKRLKKTYFNKHVTDVSKTPVPKWNLIDKSRYLYTNILCASRGCPFDCEFCYNSCEYIHHKYRNRPVENVIKEIRQLGTKHVMFIDDNFIGDPVWAGKIVEAIKPLGLIWHGAVSVNVGKHLELLDSMAESGCRSLFIGFESVNSESVKSVNKKQNRREDYDRTIGEIHKRGIMVNASMVFGFDYDYPCVFENTLEWLINNKIETITAHILTPYPGTKLFKRLESEGRIKDHNWDHYNTSNVVFEPKNMSSDELYSGYRWIYNEFYSLKNIFRRMPDQQRMPYLLFNFGYRKFGKITSGLGKIGLMSSVGKLARRLSYGIE
jgi:radical SAM superfamily enzyme YgiQ (UPF0313 family)